VASAAETPKPVIKRRSEHFGKNVQNYKKTKKFMLRSVS